MAEQHFTELTDEEIDAVSGGQIYGNSLVAIDNALNNILNHNNVANNNHVSVAAGVLSGLVAARSV